MSNAVSNALHNTTPNPKGEGSNRSLFFHEIINSARTPVLDLNRPNRQTTNRTTRGKRAA